MDGIRGREVMDNAAGRTASGVTRPHHHPPASGLPGRIRRMKMRWTTGGGGGSGSGSGSGGGLNDRHHSMASPSSPATVVVKWENKAQTLESEKWRNRARRKRLCACGRSRKGARMQIWGAYRRPGPGEERREEPKEGEGGRGSRTARESMLHCLSINLHLALGCFFDQPRRTGATSGTNGAAAVGAATAATAAARGGAMI
ncbi:hypothetical protein B0T26DRAFT_288442 [Lasiosphaeria miniovina]|uniref:Uncharacterized protein n=1 Tax=Lasiosphaeria miniovina TaxID=1954250 RepID=A0AA40AJW0_9PEZI|nr:uncharacterized protein B0T26DRAFT_288442 [Lasiosphaeria miniovina]KAK0717204.1 hypothetical protein B0T26DRAFT_288442 [Lasiosphaeria miniovina]